MMKLGRIPGALALLGALGATGCSDFGTLRTLAAVLHWSTSQQTAFAVNVGCNAFDAAQTDWAVQNGMDESNPVYGDHPSTSRIVGTKVVGLLMEESFVETAFKPEDRMLPLLALTAGCVAVVGHNYRAGARP